MMITATPLAGVYMIDIEPLADERGFFARTLCEQEFSDAGLQGRFIQHSVSWNPHAGTLRGLHFQAAPHAECKLVRVTRGAVFDVVVDMRPQSPDFGKWHAVELSAYNHRQLYLPAGIAHGFQTLLPETEVLYAMDSAYHRASARGVRWNDPALAIDWPACEDRLISQQDRCWPDLLQDDRL